MKRSTLHRTLNNTLKDISNDLIEYLPKTPIQDLNILYIDDEVRGLRSFKAISRNIFNVITAESINEAKELIKENNIDMIMCDYSLQEKLSDNSCNELYALVDNIEVAIVTGRTKEELSESISKYEFIKKPFSIFDIINSNTFKRAQLSHTNI